MCSVLPRKHHTGNTETKFAYIADWYTHVFVIKAVKCSVVTEW